MDKVPSIRSVENKKQMLRFLNLKSCFKIEFEFKFNLEKWFAIYGRQEFGFLGHYMKLQYFRTLGKHEQQVRLKTHDTRAYETFGRLDKIKMKKKNVFAEAPD